VSLDKDRKRAEGAVRNAAWQALTPAAKLAELDRRLGPGQGARRQRAKLAQEMTAK
jgi:hypothetical protein